VSEEARWESNKSQHEVMFKRLDKLEEEIVEHRVDIKHTKEDVTTLKKESKEHRGDTDKNTIMLLKIFMFSGAVVTVIGGIAWAWNMAKELPQ